MFHNYFRTLLEVKRQILNAIGNVPTLNFGHVSWLNLQLKVCADWFRPGAPSDKKCQVLSYKRDNNAWANCLWMPIRIFHPLEWGESSLHYFKLNFREKMGAQSLIGSQYPDFKKLLSAHREPFWMDCYLIPIFQYPQTQYPNTPILQIDIPISQFQWPISIHF